VGQFIEEVIVNGSELILVGIEDVEDVLRLEGLGQRG
jgi:hypothetical protein